MGAIRQFSCPELPKPIKVQDESNFGRVFNQETQNPIRAVRNRCFAAFYRRETATQIPQAKNRPSLVLRGARLMAT
jgi:hypothetical protein